MKYLIIASLLALFWPLSSVAHPGRMVEGTSCHTNRTTGVYHCDHGDDSSSSAGVTKSESKSKSKSSKRNAGTGASAAPTWWAKTGPWKFQNNVLKDPPKDK
jgi:hypothetical protein